ncbi:MULTISPECIES: hypothetical protein [unclassified Micromonospora]|uniref:hypothetical protein n=1 Tax=unclassified Micromonospora TaxID=2617518 RepID=UPI0020B26019|nr:MULTISPECIES: hypothetical protein [unclassified Micromonospora]MDM4783396.1 hypothetical protein [Micromonospora sp. b486]
MARHRRAIPHTVTDVLLWLLATDVAAAHQPHPRNPGRCTNLRCTDQAYPCPPARDAHRAQQAATAAPRPRARVASALTGWFRPSRTHPRAA